MRLWHRTRPVVLYCGSDARYAALLCNVLEHTGFEVMLSDSEERCAAFYDRAHPDVILFDHPPQSLDNLALERFGVSAPSDMQIVLLVQDEQFRTQRQDDLRPHGLEILPRTTPLTRLATILQSIVNARAASLRELLVFEDVELDLASFRVFRKEREVCLGPLEFRLLRHFIGDPYRVFSRLQLAQTVWRRDVYIGSRTVDVHISRLRCALNQQSRRKLIRTVRGAGYALS